MPLPAALAPLAGRIVRSKSRKSHEGIALDDEDQFGILFDWEKLGKGQQRALLDHFSDSEPGSDFKDVLGKDGKLAPGVVPFVMWGVDKDALDADKKGLVAPYAKSGLSYPEFSAMWFLHRDGHVTFAPMDGTFIPEKKSHALAKHVDALGLHAWSEPKEREVNGDAADGGALALALVKQKLTAPAVTRFLATVGAAKAKPARDKIYGSLEGEYIHLPDHGISLRFGEGSSGRSLVLHEILFHNGSRKHGTFTGALPMGLSFDEKRAKSKTKMGHSTPRTDYHRPYAVDIFYFKKLTAYATFTKDKGAWVCLRIDANR